MQVNAPKKSPDLTLVSSPYLHDDGKTPKTIAEILGRPKDKKRELVDFSDLVQSRVEIEGNTVTLTLADGKKIQLSNTRRVSELTTQGGNPLSKTDIIAFIQEVFGKNDMPEGNENFFMLGGIDDELGRETVKFFHSVVGLEHGKHYWLQEPGLTLYIDTQTEMLYIVKLDGQSRAYNL